MAKFYYGAALNAGRSSQEKTACLSVRLSNACILKIGKTFCPDIYTIQSNLV